MEFLFFNQQNHALNLENLSGAMALNHLYLYFLMLHFAIFFALDI
jgi:hypothetical protein